METPIIKLRAMALLYLYISFSPLFEEVFKFLLILFLLFRQIFTARLLVRLVSAPINKVAYGKPFYKVVPLHIKPPLYLIIFGNI